MDVYRQLIRPALFRLDAERAHRVALASLSLLGKSRQMSRLVHHHQAFDHSLLHIRVAGINFPNPLMLAAGLDKNAVAVDGLAALGFGAVEVGSVSADASRGNPRPRLTRLVQDQAVLVNYGVPNDGIDQVAKRLISRRSRIPVGLNLVETNRNSEKQDSAEVVAELTLAAKKAVGACDYLMLNLNCPNSGQGRSPLDDLGRLTDLLERLSAVKDLPPLFLKPSATSQKKSIFRLLEAVDPFENIGGFAFNVAPLAATDLKSPAAKWRDRPGVVCGPPLRASMRQTLKAWTGLADRKRYAFIASGGITDPDDAYQRIRDGASLLQIYTGLIYQGPQLVPRLLRGLSERLRKDGFLSVAEAVGVDAGQA